MNSHAKAVLWMGLFMIVAHLMMNWSQIRSLLFNFGTGIPGGGGDVIGNPPTQTNPAKNGKCPPGYSPQPAPNGGTVCVLHSRLPL